MSKGLLLTSLVAGLGLTLAAQDRAGSAGARPRARDIGLAPGVFAPGPLNAITDVAGVRVGHTTLMRATTCGPA